ncbi:MAG: UDP-4-amino-4,6-dideoxy-N-acetyl-beta-L-altrosamine transaminase [Butyrivibrio sp.]|uniref:UDP-4-amino-4, 6-dideoxy-N-acetyl-beta-L-altrosamine transaminase n=1 Tax=Butyrivibrio sp. TaxID=28121 RepID=UPI0025FEF74E|nr:UDP-4-amino-4,6-dideoxy-N-acetyl-beta-L-altrosamine transaminase [Butyrivibrio sp.]MCR5770772.1 UDP-4-amino-4,6-dideoxy-N-acetyl-beta-L-altrosamine transaminase [Butyrivibrio sp.]
MEKLAIEGGNPVRPEKLYYGRQWVTEEDTEEVKKTLLSDYITCGPKVDEAEKMLCKYTGAKYAVVVSNCTAALHLAAAAAGIGKGDELITTPLTFMASANCALYCGGKPVFADINPDTYNIDPDSIEAHITPNTKAVVAVDFTGQVVEADRIREICDRHGLVFIEDAAHSIGSSYDGKKVGSIADMTCFSFHPVKTVTCGEGGAILTDNKEYYEKLLLLRSHGMEHDESKMLEGPHEGIWYYEQQMLGFNYRMTDIQAALLCSQLRKIDSFIARRKEIVAKYDEAFKNIPEIIVQKNAPKSDTSRHLYIIQLDLDKLNCTRRQFFDAMSAENVQCQVHYVPVYWFPYYKSLGYKKGLCPKAEKVYKGIMSIPLYPRLTDKDVDDVIHAVTKIVENYRK